MSEIAIGNNSEQVSKGQVYALFLAVLPVILMYRTPGLGFSLATLLIAVFAVYAGIIILQHLKKVEFGLVFILSLYIGYSVYKSSGVYSVLPVLVLFHIAAISTGCVNQSYLRKCIESISVIASLGVILQQLVHILTGTHIPLIYFPGVTEDMNYYEYVVTTGMASESNLYRPASLFLEPAAFAQYVVFGLGSILFRDTPNVKKALLLTIGVFASTSGIGFVLIFAIWGWWYITYMKKKSSRRWLSTMIKLAIIFVILFILLWNIPFFNNIISRFTVHETGEYNAIDGRLFFWDSLFGEENYNSLMFGFGEQAMKDAGAYFTGFMKILYAYGIVGSVLFAIFLLSLLFHVKNNLARMFVIIYIGLLFFANLTGFINIIFFIGTTLVFSQMGSKTSNKLAIKCNRYNRA